MDDNDNEITQKVYSIFQKIKTELTESLDPETSKNINIESYMIDFLKKQYTNFIYLVCQNMAIDICILESIFNNQLDDEIEEIIINFHSDLKKNEVYKNNVENYNYSNKFIKNLLKNKYKKEIDYDLLKKNYNINSTCVSVKKSELIFSLLSNKQQSLKKSSAKKIEAEQIKTNLETSFSDTQNITTGSIYYVAKDSKGNELKDTALTKYLNLMAKSNLQKSTDNKDLEALLLALGIEDGKIKNKILFLISLLKKSIGKNKILFKEANTYYMYLIKLYFPNIEYYELNDKYAEINQNRENYESIILDNKFVNTELKPIFKNLFDSIDFEEKEILQRRHNENCVVIINYINLINLLLLYKIPFDKIDKIFNYLELRIVPQESNLEQNVELKILDDINIYDKSYNFYKIEGKYNTNSLNNIATYIQNLTSIPIVRIKQAISS